MRPPQQQRYTATLWIIFALCCGAAHAQSYPAKPIHMVVSFPAGGPSDLLGRALIQKLAEQLGQNVVPDNRVGAGVDPWPGTLDDLARLVKNETARYAGIAKRAGLKPE